jgi:hypothetical protein
MPGTDNHDFKKLKCYQISNLAFEDLDSLHRWG